MLITRTTIVTFDPVKEYAEMCRFEAVNPDWEKHEATTGVCYIQTTLQTVTPYEDALKGEQE